MESACRSNRKGKMLLKALKIFDLCLLLLLVKNTKQNLLNTAPISSIVLTFQVFPNCSMYSRNCFNNSTNVTWWGSNSSPADLDVSPSYWTEARSSEVTYWTEVICHVIDQSNISITVIIEVTDADGSVIRSNKHYHEVLLSDLVTVRLVARTAFVFAVFRDISIPFINVNFVTGTPPYMGLIKSLNDTTNINQFVDDIRFLALNSSSDLESCEKGQNTTLPSDRTSICEISLLNLPEEDCKFNPSGRDYRGAEGRTISGKTCLFWSEATDLMTTFGDYSGNLEENFCRNPDPYFVVGPWCYYDNTSDSREICGVPTCDEFYTNVAFSGEVISEPSEYQSKLVDGSVLPVITGCSVTDVLTAPWWSVKLTSRSKIYSVVITTCDSPLDHFVVGVTDDPGSAAAPNLGTYDVVHLFPTSILRFSSVSIYLKRYYYASYVILQKLFVVQRLSALEVQVMGSPSETTQQPEFPLATFQNSMSTDFYNYTWKDMGSFFSRANLVGRSEVKPLQECLNSCLTSYGEECLAVQYAPLTSECWSRVGTDWSDLSKDFISWPNIRQYALYARCPLYSPIVDIRGSFRYSSRYTVEVECNHAHHFLGQTHFTMSCLSNGTWFPEFIVCLPVLCPNISTLGANFTTNTTEVTHDTFVALQCLEGHRFPTNGKKAMVVTCLETGSWDMEIPSSCDVVHCPPLNLTSSNVTSSSGETRYNTTVELLCHSGHSFDGMTIWKSITCLENGDWNDTVMECQETKCPIEFNQFNLSTPDGSTTANYSFNSTQTFVCIDGYKFPSTNETTQISTCSDVGMWSPELIACVEITCPLPTVTPPNTTISLITLETIYPLHYTIFYQCIPGTWLPDKSYNQSSTCIAPGMWSPEPIACDEVICSFPPSIPGTFRTSESTLQKSTFQYLSWVEYLCGSGTKLEDGTKLQNLTCSELGEWQPAPRTCFDVHCPILDKNGSYTLSSEDTIRGSIVTLTCAEGHWLPDRTKNKAFECLDSENWSEPIEDCQLVQCQDLNSTQNKYLLSDNNTSYLTNVTLICDLGYMFRDGSLERNVTCLVDGNWDQTIDPCVEIVCPFLPVVPNADIIDYNFMMTSFPFSTIFGYKCIVGTRMDSGEIIQNLTCGGLGVWLPLEPEECKDVHCPPLNRASSNYSLSTFEDIRSTSVDLTCVKGHSFPGGERNVTATCLDTGDWSLNVSDCTPVSCSMLDPEGSNFTIDSNLRIYLSLVNVVCNTGFKFPDDTTWKTITCTSDQLWNWTTPFCQRITCSGLPVIRNAIYRSAYQATPLSTDETYSFDYNTTLTLECLYGYNLYDSGFVVQKTSCLGLGEWKPTPINCTDVYCPALNSSSTYTLSSTSSSIRRTVVTATCLVGYVFGNGVKRWNLTCTDDGVWSGTLEDCIVVTCPTLNSVAGNYTISSNDSSYNSMVFISCILFNAFPDGRISKQVVCLDSGNWSEEIGQCLWVWCSALLAPSNLTLLDPWQPLYRMYTRLRYRCQVGMKLSNNLQDQTLECLGTGSWNPPAFARCQDVLCPSLSSISNVAVDTMATKYMTQVLLTCPDYMLFQNRKFWRNITCLENGFWNETDLTCTALNCPPINITATLTINTTLTVAGTVVQVRCQDQSTFPDGSIMKYVTCGRYGNWSDPSLVCKDFIRCPTLTPASHCSSNLFVSRKVEMTVLTCDIGFMFRFGGRTRTMMCVSGRWSAPAPRCTPSECLITAQSNVIVLDNYQKISKCLPEEGTNICAINPSTTACLLKDSQCGGFPSLKYATMELDTQNKNLSVRCDPGYRFPDGKTELFVDCANINNNIFQVTDCQIITCPPLIGYKLTLSSTSMVFNSSVDVTCWNKHAFPDGRTFLNVVCLMSGLWSEPISSCTEVYCGAPLPFSGSYYLEKIAYPTYPMNQGFTLQCKEGLKFEDGSTNMTLTCGSRGVWVPERFTCASNRCDPVPLVYHGMPSTTISLSGTVVKYSCLPGYELANPLAYYLCNGTDWVMKEPITCKEVVCGDLQTENAVVGSGNGNIFNVVITVECKIGYRYRGQRTVEVRCLESGTWSLAEVKCTPVDCQAPPEVINGLLALPPFFSSIYLDIVTYTCIDGYWYTRGRTKEIVTCSEDGLWVTDPTKLRCYNVTCPPITSANLNSTSVTYGSVVSLTCPSTPNATQIATCSISGTWLPPPVPCAAPERKEQRSVSEAANSDIIGIASISLIAFVLFILFLLDLPTIMRQIRYSRCIRRLKKKT